MKRLQQLVETIHTIEENNQRIVIDTKDISKTKIVSIWLIGILSAIIQRLILEATHIVIKDQLFSLLFILVLIVAELQLLYITFYIISKYIIKISIKDKKETESNNDNKTEEEESKESVVIVLFGFLIVFIEFIILNV